MSFVSAVPDLVRGAAEDLAGVGSSLTEAAVTASGPTTGIAAAARDEVSIAIASLFGELGQEFQALSARAQAFHAQFVGLLSASAGAYVRAEVANAQQALLGGAGTPAQAVQAAAADLDLIASWQQVFNTTSQNAQTVFGATQEAVNTLSGGVSTAFGTLTRNPAAFFGNVQTALQSVLLVGSPDNVVSAVVNHTLGGITTAIAGDGTPTAVNDAHIEIYQGLVGQGDFNSPSGLEGALVSAVTNAASSPLSGVLLGAVGPFVSPGVALGNSLGAFLTDLTGGNPTAALSDLLNAPANVVNGFFNGATLNLNPLAPVFSPFVSAGDNGGEQLNGLGLAFGGLFSPGQVISGPGGPMYHGTGGSALNALGLNISFLPPDPYAGGHVDIPAIPIGPIGAISGLVDILGQALGGSLLD